MYSRASHLGIQSRSANFTRCNFIARKCRRNAYCMIQIFLNNPKIDEKSIQPPIDCETKSSSVAFRHARQCVPVSILFLPYFRSDSSGIYARRLTEGRDSVLRASYVPTRFSSPTFNRYRCRMIGMELMLSSLFFCHREFSCESVRERNLIGDEEDCCVSRDASVCIYLFFPKNLKLKWGKRRLMVPSARHHF